MGYCKTLPRRRPRDSIRTRAWRPHGAGGTRGQRRESPVRFIRLAVLEPHPASGRPTGVFQAAYALKGSDGLAQHEYAALVEALRWFERNLRSPRDLDEPRAIFWFKCDAGPCTRRIWHLVHLLRAHDVPVWLLKTRRPGQVVYEDEHQIAAVPERR